MLSMQDMIGDANPMVVANAVAALSEIQVRAVVWLGHSRSKKYFFPKTVVASALAALSGTRVGCSGWRAGAGDDVVEAIHILTTVSTTPGDLQPPSALAAGDPVLPPSLPPAGAQTEPGINGVLRRRSRAGRACLPSTPTPSSSCCAR